MTSKPISKRSGLLAATATCWTCGWELEARNAVGAGAQHAYRTGHYVQTQQTIGTSYNIPVKTDGE